MLTLAALGYYESCWSVRIVAEMRRNVLTDYPDIDSDRFDAVTITACVVPSRLRGSASKTTSSSAWTTRPRTVTCRRR